MTTDHKEIPNNDNGNDNNVLKAAEMLTIPTEMASLIHDEINPNAFSDWQSGSCVIEPIATPKVKAMRLLLSGDPAENESLLARIWPVLEQAQEHSFHGHFILTLGLLVPSQKCGYVVGKKLKTLHKIQDDFGVNAILDNGKREPIPADFARLIIRSSNIEAMKGARAEIRRLEARSLEFNPFGLAYVKRQQEESGGGATEGGGGERKVQERIRLPAWDQFSKMQKGHILEIQKTSSIDWTFDETQSLAEPVVTREGRYVTLEGDAERVLGAKRRLAKLISEIEMEDDRNSSSIRLSTSPTTGRAAYRVIFKVPTPAWKRVIGDQGRTIKALRARFDVIMGFLGDNYVAYPEFRMLRISGYNEQNVRLAREHIERDFIAGDRPQFNNSGGERAKQRQPSSSSSNNSNFNALNGNTTKNNNTNSPLMYREPPAGGWGWESDSDDTWGNSELQVCPDFAPGGGVQENEKKIVANGEVREAEEEQELPKWDDDEERDGGEKEKQEKRVEEAQEGEKKKTGKSVEFEETGRENNDSHHEEDEFGSAIDMNGDGGSDFSDEEDDEEDDCAELIIQLEQCVSRLRRAMVADAHELSNTRARLHDKETECEKLRAELRKLQQINEAK